MLSPYWPYILLLLVLLVLLTALFLYLVLRRARGRAAGLAPAAPGVAVETVAPRMPVSALGLKASFKRAVRLMRASVTYRDHRYHLPWFLMIGEADSGKTTALLESGLDHSLERPVEQAGGVKQGVNWFLFDRGVVLDVAGDIVLRPDGEPADGEGWNQLARLLQKHRPERPLDGIVLTIPCADLIAARSLGFAGRARIEQKAAHLYRKLWQAQKHLGMSFPVYVLVTKCDKLTGFSSLCRELPQSVRDGIFGWSNPYALETAYRPGWVEEAFQNVYRYALQAQVEVFTERDEVYDGDGIFLLPSEIQALKAPLQLYLDHIFKQSSFHDPFFFRGLYFCGDDGDDQLTHPQPPQPSPKAGIPEWALLKTENSTVVPLPPPAPPSGRPGARSLAFLKDLFEQKIFREDMLAHPVAKTMLSRNRTVLAAQVLSLAIPILGCGGLLLTYNGLEQRSDELRILLEQEEKDLREVKERRAVEGSAPRSADYYSSNSYGPPAYVRPNADTARRATEPGGVYAQTAAYSQNVEATLEGPPPSPPDAEATAGNEWNEVHDNEQNLLSAMARVNARNYYSVFIPTSWFSDINRRTHDAFVNSFQYVILEDLRLELEARTDDFLKAVPIRYSPGASAGERADLGAGDQPPPDAAPVYDQPFEPDADATLHGFIERFGVLRAQRARYEGLAVRGNGSLEELKALSVYLGHEWPRQGFDNGNKIYREALERAEGDALKPTSAAVQRDFKELVAMMVEVLYQRSFERRRGGVSYDYLPDVKRTEALLSRPENTWLATYVFDGRSAFYDRTLLAALDELRKALEGLRDEEFMRPGVAYAAPPVKMLTRRQLVWDTALLRQAVAMCTQYERYAGARDVYSRRLDNAVTQTSLAQLRANVTALVVRAQHYEPAAQASGEAAMRTSLTAEVKSLEQSREALTQLLDATTRLDIDVGLRAALANQGAYLVGAINREFDAGRFYAMARPNFDWWDGSQPISNIAFAADGPDDLAAYLASERKRIAYLARELAAPVFDFLAAQNISTQAIRANSRVDWDELLAQLERYDNKQPGNSVAVLEGFVLTGMDKASADACKDLESAPSGGAARDFFIQTRNYLRLLLYRRCDVLARRNSADKARLADKVRADSLENYRDIANEFDRLLAERFPFADAPGGVPLAEADPESIAAFFRTFDEKKAAAREALKQNRGLGASGEEAKHFLDRLDETRDFFAAFLDKKQGPFVDFNLQFRVNRKMESEGANQIIDWTLDVGRKKYRYLDQQLTGRWVAGEPVRLTLRWANNSPSVPFTNPDTQTLRVRDRVAVFDFKSRWALLALMRQQATDIRDYEYGVDTEVYTLKFKVPTQPAGGTSDGRPPWLRQDEAEVFMRLSLIAPDMKGPLNLPQAFPVRAPRL